MYKRHECCSAAGRGPRQALTYISYDKADNHTHTHTRPPPPPLRVKRTCSDRLTFTLQLSIKYWAMDLTKASKKYQEYCRDRQTPTTEPWERTSGHPKSGKLFWKSQIFYLEQLVACEEVGGGLEDGGHGFRQLLVHRSRGAGGERLSLEHKLTRTSVQWKRKNKETRNTVRYANLP